MLDIQVEPTEYDVIIVGTGLTESIIAASLSRIGIQSDPDLPGPRFTGRINFPRYRKLAIHISLRYIGHPDLPDKTLSPEYPGISGSDCANFVVVYGIGKTVLHLDTLDYYGEQWASFTLNQLEREVAKQPSSNPGLFRPFYHDLKLENLFEARERDREIEEKDKERGEREGERDPEEKDPDEKEIIEQPAPSRWTKQTFEKTKRRVNIDLTPKVCLSNGPMVSLIRSSNCSRFVKSSCFINLS
eukprot:sb/3468957/